MLRVSSDNDPIKVKTVDGSGLACAVDCYGFAAFAAAEMAVASVLAKLFEMDNDRSLPQEYRNHSLVSVSAPGDGDGGAHFVTTLWQGELDVGSRVHRGIVYRYHGHKGERTSVLSVVRREWLMTITDTGVSSCKLFVGGVVCE